MSALLSPSRRCLLAAYYAASWPSRRCRHALAARRHLVPITILFYHRVADRCPNDWTMSTAEFQRQIDWLAQHFEVVSLREAQRRLQAGNARPSACITFDDGYAENCDFALPLLRERNLPCAYFVASDFVFRQQPFPHDVAAGAPLPPNTVAQLRQLAESGVEIGAHTRGHVDLGRMDDFGEIERQVVGSRDDLQQALGVPVRYFAFPYGLPANLHPAAFRIAGEAGFRGVCSAYGGYNTPGDDVFHLQRAHADPDMTRFKNWLTIDPRKVASVQRYSYGDVMTGFREVPERAERRFA